MKKIFFFTHSIFLFLVILSVSEGFSQNVGIGTTVPTGKLQLNHRSQASSPSLVIFDSSTSSAGRIKFLNSGGNRYWQVNTIVNNAIPSGHYMDIVTDSLWIMTLRGNGNVGINNSLPAYKLDVSGDGYFQGILRVNDRLGLGVTNPTEKLDVNGNINLNGVLKVNGSAGTAGQVLTSNGTGDPQWKNGAYGNNSRFAADIPITSGPVSLPYSTIYNLNPADVTIGTTTITINKTGLWHFEGYTYSRILWSSPPPGQYIHAFLSVDGKSYYFMETGVLDRVLNETATYARFLNFSHDIFLRAPAIVYISVGFQTPSSGPAYLVSSTRGLISGYLISE